MITNDFIPEDFMVVSYPVHAFLSFLWLCHPLPNLLRLPASLVKARTSSCKLLLLSLFNLQLKVFLGHWDTWLGSVENQLVLIHFFVFQVGNILDEGYVGSLVHVFVDSLEVFREGVMNFTGRKFGRSWFSAACCSARPMFSWLVQQRMRNP